MRAWTLISSLDSKLKPEKTKVHLATHNGRENPLDLYRENPKRFQEWQRWQSKRNFEREFVVALIEMPETHQWLFAGAYTSGGCNPDGKGYMYKLEPRTSCDDIDGRLVVRFKRPGRQPYLYAESCIEHALLAELRSERLSTPKFPGFKGLHLKKAQLDAIVRQRCLDWHAALSSVGGVYLIADAESGKFYVGSATGEGGIWQRWMEYAVTGHGGNRRLEELLKAKDAATNLQFSILEIADTHTSEADVLRREVHWKQILLTRIHGLNAN
jgi:hypothetical protein